MGDDGNQLKPEMLVPRLGEALVAGGRISDADLDRALTFQHEHSTKERGVLLGDALLELGLIDRPTLDQAITEQVLQLRLALEAANSDLERRIRDRTQELQRAVERLAELGELKANFMANISRELRTPLSQIKGFLELMISNTLGPLTEEQRHAIHMSQKGAHRLEESIEDLLMFSSASRGEMSLHLEPLDLRDLVERAIANVTALTRERGVEVRFAASNGIPLIQGDEEKILWALNQLLENAVKVTDAGGQATVSLAEQSPNLVIVSVTDSGAGIPAERLRGIFEPLQHLDGSARPPMKGLGLRLALVKHIIEGHGSALHVDSVEGQGTTASFPLLVAPRTEAAAGPHQSS
jgi:two-component system phosphate regulon sensor histidine kinase PhoR